jgi:hypothetical protein
LFFVVSHEDLKAHLDSYCALWLGSVAETTIIIITVTFFFIFVCLGRKTRNHRKLARSRLVPDAKVPANIFSLPIHWLKVCQTQPGVVVSRIEMKEWEGEIMREKVGCMDGCIRARSEEMLWSKLPSRPKPS